MQPTERVMVALERLKGFFLEAPGLRLSPTEAQEVSGLDDELCGLLLSALVDVRFLIRESDGAYRLRSSLFGDGPVAKTPMSLGMN
jgi:hypothetical protein